MPCYRPLHGFPYPSSSSKYGQYMVYNALYHKEPILDEGTGELLEEIEIPCGKCVGCRLDYSRSWATRMCLESLTFKENYFITLTYDDIHVHHNDDGALTLSKTDISEFLKRLRSSIKYHTGQDGVRFFACAEYGENSFRPHYHVCLFNAPLLDNLKLEGNNKLGQPLFSSSLVQDAWNMGHTCVGKMTWNTCAYTARYTLKKAGGKDNAFYEALNVVPEFVRMSRRPGIGLEYFDENYQRIYNDGQIILPALSKDKPNIQGIPKYFDKKLKEIDPMLLCKAKERRRIVAQMEREAKLKAIGLDEAEYFELEERRVSERLKKLVRNL